MKNLFSDLYETIELRKKSNKKNSYTKKLFKEGEKRIAQKFGEESSELLIDFLKGSKKRTTEEAIDVIYHLFVLLSSKKIKFSDLEKEILNRPSRVLAMKEILRNRVIIKLENNFLNHKPCPLLSEVSLYNAFVSNLKRDRTFDPLNFNPLKYNFEFHAPTIQRFRVDNSNYFIIIKPQNYNN